MIFESNSKRKRIEMSSLQFFSSLVFIFAESVSNKRRHRITKDAFCLTIRLLICEIVIRIEYMWVIWNSCFNATPISVQITHPSRSFQTRCSMKLSEEQFFLLFAHCSVLWIFYVFAFLVKMYKKLGDLLSALFIRFISAISFFIICALCYWCVLVAQEKYQGRFDKFSIFFDISVFTLYFLSLFAVKSTLIYSIFSCKNVYCHSNSTGLNEGL